MFNDKGIQCDKTAAEIAALHPDGYYYRSDEPLVFWYESSTGNYRADLPASLKNKYLSPSYTQVPCGFCAFWYFREKRKFVPTGSFTYSPITYQRLCADSVRTLFRGKEVLLRQSTDSVITRQFSDDGINW